jgi:adenosine deaminase
MANAMVTAHQSRDNFFPSMLNAPQPVNELSSFYTYTALLSINAPCFAADGRCTLQADFAAQFNERTRMQNPYRPPLLHDHMDGCLLLLPHLLELYRLSGKTFPFDPSMDTYPSQVRASFRNAPDIVEAFKTTTGVMQSKEALRLAAYAYTTGRAKQGYQYCEVTIAPQYHTFGGLTEVEVVGALIEGIKKGETEFPQIEVNILFTVGREVDPKEGVRLVNAAYEAAQRYDGSYIAGIGLACAEPGNPPEKHTPLFRRAGQLGFKTTCHAGEWVKEPCSDPAQFAEENRNDLLYNMWIAVADIGVQRIGHAIPLAYDRLLREYVINNDVGIEWCPGSNLSSGLIPNFEYLRMPELLDAGVMGCINPDDDLFMPDMDEIVCAGTFSDENLACMERNAWFMRFGHRKNH